jgi:tetratricopeptide (TPR) repeat protein
MDGDVHSSLADNYKAMGDTVKCKEVLTEAFAKYPNSQSVLVALINVYMESNDDPEKILEILKVAQTNEPNNASLVYAEGSLYKKLNQFEKAIASFHKASEVDAKYVFAPFAEGCAYYDWAVDLQEKAQAELDDAKYNALLEQMEKALNDAIAPFEKAFEIAEDKDIKLACAEYLKSIYFRFREKGADYQANHEKYNKYVEENK